MEIMKFAVGAKSGGHGLELVVYFGRFGTSWWVQLKTYR